MLLLSESVIPDHAAQALPPVAPAAHNPNAGNPPEAPQEQIDQSLDASATGPPEPEQQVEGDVEDVNEVSEEEQEEESQLLPNYEAVSWRIN